jgi:DNA gyrase subunit A
MGIFDLETGTDDPPVALSIADQSQDLLIITSQARAFRLPVTYLPESGARARGQQLAKDLSLAPDEKISLILPHQQSGYLNVMTRTAQLRRLRHHFFGENMVPGNLIYDTRNLGAPAAACWSDGTGDIVVATRQGKAVRFPETSIPFKGCLAIRLNDGDEIAGVAAVNEATGLFLLTADGKGTVRLMTGFGANKAPGAGGKSAIKSNQVVGIVPVSQDDDLFIISRLSKLIRFRADEVPAKEGVVQGVNCMALRGDDTVAVVAGGQATP